MHDKQRCRLTTDSSSYSRMSYSEMATRNTIAVTFSKQWILQGRSERHQLSRGARHGEEVEV